MFRAGVEEGRRRPDDRVLRSRRSIRISTRPASRSRRCRRRRRSTRSRRPSRGRRRRPTRRKATFELEGHAARRATRRSTKTCDDRRRQGQGDARRRSRPTQTPMIETLLMIRQPERLEQVNKDWPLDKMLAGRRRDVQAARSPRTSARSSTSRSTAKALFDQMLTGLAQTHQNPRLDPTSPQFDKDAFGDPAAGRSSRCGRASTRRGPSCASSTRR